VNSLGSERPCSTELECVPSCALPSYEEEGLLHHPEPGGFQHRHLSHKEYAMNERPEEELPEDEEEELEEDEEEEEEE
jgi:hypothetical protein